MRPVSRAVFLLMDGARADVFAELLAKGDLPHIARHVIEPGSNVVGTTVFPSVTRVAYVPFLFGRYPGAMDVPGLRWLDRAGAAGTMRDQFDAARSYCGVQASRLDGDIRPAEGMFSLVPESIALNPWITRGLAPGANRIQRRLIMLGTIAHYNGNYAAFDDAVTEAWIAAAAERWRFLFVVFAGIDGIAHLRDPFHPEVLEAYRRADRALGAFVASAVRHGEKPLLIVASDHGLSAVPNHWDVAEELEKIGTPTVRHPWHVWRRGARAAVMVSGNASAQVYVEPRSGRPARTASELPAELLAWLRSQPAVDLAAWRADDGGVIVARGGDAAHLAAGGEGLTYRPLGGDPIGLGTAPLALGDAEMLLRSRATHYPDAPRQLVQLFQSARAGDIVLSAAPGADFRRSWEIPEHRSGHGSLRRDNMDIPIAVSVPLGDAPVRSVDLMPLMLDHLGIPLPAGLDGRAPQAGSAQAEVA